MNKEMNFRNPPNRGQPDRRQLDAMCARFATLRTADAAAWLAAGDRLGRACLALGRRIARRRAERRRERHKADEIAWGL